MKHLIIITHNVVLTICTVCTYHIPYVQVACCGLLSCDECVVIGDFQDWWEFLFPVCMYVLTSFPFCMRVCVNLTDTDKYCMPSLTLFA